MLSSEKEFRGSGAIIAPKWIITHATNIYMLNTTYISVGGISSGQDDSEELYEVEREVLHPYVNQDGYWKNGIALIQTKEAIHFKDSVKPIRLGGNIKVNGGVPVQVCGWGTSDLVEVTPKLTCGSFLTISNESCYDEMKWQTYFLNKNILCATGYTGEVERWCFKDHGSPLVAGGLLVGIASSISGMSCSSYMSLPNLAYRIDPYAVWIRATIESFEM